MKKIGIGLVIIALLAAAGWGVMVWQQQAQPAQEILRTGTITHGNLEITIAASGNVAARQISELRFDLPGMVAAVHVEMGDRVAAHDTLATLDARSLERAVKQAAVALEEAHINLRRLKQPADEADIELAKLAVQVAEYAMSSAKTSEEVAAAQGGLNVRLATERRDDVREAHDNVFDRLDDFGVPAAYGAGVEAAYMEAEGAVGITQLKSDYQMQQAQSGWWSAYQSREQAAERLRTLQQGPDADRIKQIELQIAQAELALKEAKQRLEEATLRAPHGGVVAAVNVQAALPTPNGLPAIILVDDSRFYIDVTVDETDVGKIAEGQPVDVTLDAYPDVILSGVIERITSVSQPAEGVIAYPVRVSLTDPGATIARDGMTASIIVRAHTVADVLLAPNWAVRTDQATGETYAYVTTQPGATPQRVAITIGARNERYTEIVAGLEEGQTVVLIPETRNLMEMQGPPSRGM